MYLEPGDSGQVFKIYKGDRVMSGDQQRKVRNIIRWQRIGCIVVKISETLNVSLLGVLNIYELRFVAIITKLKVFMSILC